MFSLNIFYQIITQNLISPLDNFLAQAFSKFGSNNIADLEYIFSNIEDYESHIFEMFPHCVRFYDQEPFYHDNIIKQLFYYHPKDQSNIQDSFFSYCDAEKYFKPNCLIIANSEYSQEKTDLINYFGYYDWYYFFHGFAALDWFRNIRYMVPIRNYSKVFITFNNLTTEKRSYRLNLVARILEKKLDGHISLNVNNEQIKTEIFNSDSLLSKESKRIVLEQLMGKSKLTIDTDNQHGA
jgi:hypothetical protein